MIFNIYQPKIDSYPMKQSIASVTVGVLLVFLFSAKAYSQSFTIDGITGIDFDTTGGDYSVAISNPFTVFGINVATGSLTISYTEETETFEIDGNTTITFDGESIDAEVDFIVTNKTLQSVVFNASSTFQMRSLTIEPDSLGFEWLGGTDFGIYGGATVTIDGNTATVQIGQDSAFPGISINNGIVTSVIMTVTGNFNLKNISVAPDALTFSYDSGESRYEMYGSATTTVDGNQISISLGDEDNPGLILNSGTLTHINFGVTADFTMKGITVSPSDLTFQYDLVEDYYEFFGDVSVKFDGEEIDASLGDADNPGIIFNAEIITSINFGLSGTFLLKNLSVTPEILSFQWDAGSSHFEMFGAASISFSGHTASVGLGDDSTPGLVIESGTITALNMSLTTDFSVDGLAISPDNLTLVYSSADNQYEADGNISLTLDGNTVNGTLGDDTNPGFVIQNGNLTNFDISVTGNIDLKGLSFTTDALTFIYDSGNDYFEMYGAASTTVDGNGVALSFGDASNPGIIVDGGALTHLNSGITADFTMKGITISPTNLTLEYDSGNTQYEFYGDLTVKFNGEEASASFGTDDNPGMVYKSGAITHINFGVTADFSVKGITVSPQSFTFEYDQGSDHFEMYGTVAVKFDGEEINANLGDNSNPGIVYKNGSITHVNFGLTADFTIKSLSVTPTNLTFEYDEGSNHFEMYGDLTFKIGNDVLTANMGDATNPGLIYLNNSIQHVNIGVTSEFSLNGLKIKTNNLGADWNGGTDYHIYGDADLSIENENIDTDFGTFTNPGIVVRNGSLLSFEVDVNTDLKFGNFEVQAKDLDIHYSNNIFQVRGEIELTEIFTLAVTLGSNGQEGLEIDVSGAEPRFKIEDLKIDIQHANLGTIDLKNFELEFDANGIVESDVDVILPTGTEIDARLKFVGNPAKLNSIDITYRADNLAEAIEVFEGVQIALLEASVTNLAYPSYLEVSGKLETIYGGGFSLAGQQATFLEMTDQVTITPYSLSFDAVVNVGAYRTGPDSWGNILGYGDINLYAQFGQYVKIQADVKIPGDPLIEADAVAYLDNTGHFDALLGVQFIVPRWIPFIGGKHFGSVDGAIRYNKYDVNGSYGAAWASYSIGGGRRHRHRHVHYIGAKYEFGSRKVRLIGKRKINGIRSTILSEVGKVSIQANTNSLPNTNIVHTFYVEEPAPNSMLIHIDWAEPVDSAIVSVIGPEGVYELTKAIIVSENDSTTVPTFGFEENMDLIVGDSTTSFIFTTPTANSDEEIKEASLLNGRYQLVLSFHGDTAAIDSVQFFTMWQEPESSIEVEESGTNRFNLSSDYWSSLPDSTYISFYVAGVGINNDTKLLEHVPASNFNNEGYGKENFNFIPDFIERKDTLYFFTVIDDKVNPPIVSDSSEAFVYQPDIFGHLNFPTGADSLEGGLRIFVDEDVDGSFDVESTGGLELFGITNPSGYFSISGLIPKENYEIRIVLPEGYRLVGGTDRFSSRIFNFDGTPLELNLDIESYTEAE